MIEIMFGVTLFAFSMLCFLFVVLFGFLIAAARNRDNDAK